MLTLLVACGALTAVGLQHAWDPMRGGYGAPLLLVAAAVLFAIATRLASRVLLHHREGGPVPLPVRVALWILWTATAVGMLVVAWMAYGLLEWFTGSLTASTTGNDTAAHEPIIPAAARQPDPDAFDAAIAAWLDTYDEHHTTPRDLDPDLRAIDPEQRPPVCTKLDDWSSTQHVLRQSDIANPDHIDRGSATATDDSWLGSNLTVERFTCGFATRTVENWRGEHDTMSAVNLTLIAGVPHELAPQPAIATTAPADRDATAPTSHHAREARTPLDRPIAVYEKPAHQLGLQTTDHDVTARAALLAGHTHSVTVTSLTDDLDSQDLLDLIDAVGRDLDLP